ncbi:beta-lactamase-like protein [Xylaria bambusicola]|uniref:beta-lactamase-like protein n=1 Tax=Xylaria bambusicola TaxID=326684 RepID=UPI002008E88F|nr:beta-lactamase-like protein [Xylaria bambusicola]KAI0505578.1 beta-lactamase-like protein [Xylaria bambusicola]
MTAAPSFDIPAGTIAHVYIINTDVYLTNLATAALLTPSIDGFDKFRPLASWSFLIQSSKGEKVLFDLSIPPDPASYSPAILEMLDAVSASVDGNKHVADVLRGDGIDPADIGSVIWSHHHFDHIGDITTFPKSTTLVVGPGFKNAYLPAYPTRADVIEERHLEGRTLREINFSDVSRSLTIGAFEAYDFFGDGSFYLLHTPGHTIGHLAGLARTTSSPDTFIFMGGDLCHHSGEIRPSPHLPIPANIQFPLPDYLRARISGCPGAEQFHALNHKHGRKAYEPFFEPVLAVDIPQAIQTIKDAQLADAQSNIFFVFAHDMEIQGIVDFFPHPANGWRVKGWREKSLWRFLADLTPAAVSIGQ